jgi:hypothetical protein
MFKTSRRDTISNPVNSSATSFHQARGCTGVFRAREASMQLITRSKAERREGACFGCTCEFKVQHLKGTPPSTVKVADQGSQPGPMYLLPSTWLHLPLNHRQRSHKQLVSRTTARQFGAIHNIPRRDKDFRASAHPAKASFPRFLASSDLVLRHTGRVFVDLLSQRRNARKRLNVGPKSCLVVNRMIY